MENPLILNGQKLLSRDDVAAKFGVSKVTVWKWVKNGVIRQHSFGKTVYFIEEELFEDMKRSGSFVRKSHKQKIS